MKRVLIALIFLASGVTTYAQTPEKINYQAVVRDNSGLSVTNQLCGVRVSILQGSSLGPEVFAETHGPTSNSYGLINLQIGTGANTGPTLDMLDWGADIYFVKIEIDPNGGTSYSVSSISQLVSVPYALHAKTAENVDDADADPTNEHNTGAVMNAGMLEITDGGGTISVDMSSLTSDPDMDPNNEIQTLSKVGQIVTLSNGGGAFTDDVTDADSDPTNEYNGTLQLVGQSLQLTDGGGTISADLSGLTGDADGDPLNEIQTLTKAGNIITLSNGGGSITDAVDDADPDNTNELQTISKAGMLVTLSAGGGSFTDAVDDADADPNNEIQTLSQAGNTITLSNGGGTVNIDDSDADATNEFNTGISLTGTVLNITDGGGTFSQDLASLTGGTDDQNLTLVGNILSIEDGNSVDLSGIGGGTDDQTLTLVGTNLTIEDGNTVDLSGIGGGSSFRVGQFHEGGIIVYVDTTGIHGLIAATADTGPATAFEEGGNGNALNSYGGSYYDGQANCSAFLGSAEAAEYYAVQQCDTYTGGGQTDWYLPSLYELEFLMQNNYALEMHGAGLQWGLWYWSSTDINTVGFNAYQGNASTQGTQSQSQTTTALVRPVRKF